MKVEEYLTEQGVPFELTVHEQAFTAQEVAAAEHVTGHRFAKTVVAKGPGGPCLLVLPASRHVDFSKAGKLVGEELSMASEQEMRELFPDCEIGAEPPDRVDVRMAPAEQFQSCQPLDDVEKTAAHPSQGRKTFGCSFLGKTADEHHENWNEGCRQQQYGCREQIFWKDKEQDGQRDCCGEQDLWEIITKPGSQGLDAFTEQGLNVPGLLVFQFERGDSAEVAYGAFFQAFSEFQGQPSAEVAFSGGAEGAEQQSQEKQSEISLEFLETEMLKKCAADDGSEEKCLPDRCNSGRQSQKNRQFQSPLVGGELQEAAVHEAHATSVTEAGIAVFQPASGRQQGCKAVFRPIVTVGDMWRRRPGQPSTIPTNSHSQWTGVLHL